MRSATRPSLFMMAACIAADPWVLTSNAGAVRLAPLRLMSIREQRAMPGAAVLLDLTDLGCVVEGCSDEFEPAAPSPLRMRSEVVLLVPWSLLPTVAELASHARAAPYRYEPRFAPEDWLPAWHHFIAADERPSSHLARPTERRAGLRARASSSTRQRQYVLGTVRGSQGSGFEATRGDDEGEELRERSPSVGAHVARRRMSVTSSGATVER